MAIETKYPLSHLLLTGSSWFFVSREEYGVGAPVAGFPQRARHPNIFSDDIFRMIYNRGLFECARPRWMGDESEFEIIYVKFNAKDLLRLFVAHYGGYTG